MSELCGLCWRDVQPNGDGTQITVFGKGAKTQAIQLPNSAAKLFGKLRGYSRGGRSCFPIPETERGTGTGGGVSHRARATCRAGIELAVSPHWLRHALERGVPIHLVQATFGHGSITTPAVTSTLGRGVFQQVPGTVRRSRRMPQNRTGFGPLLMLPRRS